jgi:hypothetical protein
MLTIFLEPTTLPYQPSACNPQSSPALALLQPSPAPIPIFTSYQPPIQPCQTRVTMSAAHKPPVTVAALLAVIDLLLLGSKNLPPYTEVFLLHKSLYGLTQAPCVWHDTLCRVSPTPC